MKKNIVVVGAGYAGILTAKKLAKKFKKQDDVNITIIDKNPFHTMLTELHEVAAYRVDESSIRMDLKKIFANRKVDVKLDEVQNIDFDKKVVTGKAASYEYDVVVLATGSKPTYFGVEGAKENTYTLWSYDDAVKLRDRIRDVFRTAAGVADEAARKEMLTFHVVGAGFTGVEMIGELAEYVPYVSKEYGVNPEDVTLVNVDGLSRAVPILPEKLSNRVEKRLVKMGVRLEFNSFVCAVGEDYIEYKRGDDILREKTNTVIWTAGIESSSVAAESGAKLEAAQRGGRIETDAYLRALGKEDVFVVGDNMYFIPEGQEVAVPQMVENAEHSAGTAAKNITATIKGTDAFKAYKPSFHGVMVCVGGRYGTARVGLPNFMFNLPSFLAMFAKHFINMVYFVQVLGWNQIFSYLNHEFFTVRNRRSFVGGHLSNRSPSFVSFPIRVWLGAVWAFEGIHKIFEGWLDTYQLDQFFAGANSFYEGVLNPGASSGATDATSAATGEAGASAAEILINWKFFDLFHVIFLSTTTLKEATLDQFAFKIDVPLMNWFLDNVLLKNENLAFFMQKFMVFAEIGIGLLLNVGLFTTLAAGFSIVLQLMFLTTTGWYLVNSWMFFAAFALLFTGGRALSLDYWVMPKLKELWSKIPFVKKWYIYND
ncbi:MAG: FAD-dependent oxidoreductase [Erysipelothrix sp.]|nr:FAD-dependent oxidoreductase [Erysipelothrix sp.]